MIDIDKIEKEIQEITETPESEEVSDFVLTTKNDVPEIIPEQAPEVISDVDEFTDDFVYVRNNLKDIINQGGEVIRQAVSIAMQSETPRSLEVVATLMKSVADINKDLLDVHTKKDSRVVTQPQKQTNIQNNTVFVGSTAEFSKLMKERIKNGENTE